MYISLFLKLFWDTNILEFLKPMDDRKAHKVKDKIYIYFQGDSGFSLSAWVFLIYCHILFLNLILILFYCCSRALPAPDLWALEMLQFGYTIRVITLIIHIHRQLFLSKYNTQVPRGWVGLEGLPVSVTCSVSTSLNLNNPGYIFFINLVVFYCKMYRNLFN